MSDENTTPSGGIARRDALKVMAAAAVVPMLPETAAAAPAPGAPEAAAVVEKGAPRRASAKRRMLSAPLEAPTSKQPTPSLDFVRQRERRARCGLPLPLCLLKAKILRPSA